MSGADLLTEKKHFFHEGSSMRKIGDTYYYVSRTWRRKAYGLGDMTSKSPLGPFKYRGYHRPTAARDSASWKQSRID